MTLPSNFNLNIYQLTIQALEPLKLPPFKGSALRGGFGLTFKRLVCHHLTQCRHEKRCLAGNDCPYGYVFETTPPPEATALSNIKQIPRPFIIQAPTDMRTAIPVGDRLTFGLTLIGAAANYAPHFIAVFKELGSAGLGKFRRHFTLLSVATVFPFENELAPIFVADSDLLAIPNSPTVTADGIASYAASLPANEITINFITPTRIKYKGKWINDNPPFAALIQNLVGRISSLSLFHCGQPFETDFRALIDQAQDVEIIKNTTRRQKGSRYSTRQDERVYMDGFIGEITYAGNLTNYLPILVLGELIHAGKGTVFGNGQYHILR